MILSCCALYDTNRRVAGWRAGSTALCKLTVHYSHLRRVKTFHNNLAIVFGAIQNRNCFCMMWRCCKVHRPEIHRSFHVSLKNPFPGLKGHLPGMVHSSLTSSICVFSFQQENDMTLYFQFHQFVFEKSIFKKLTP